MCFPSPKSRFASGLPFPLISGDRNLGQAEMSVSSDTGGAGKMLPRLLGGMGEALAIASDLGVPIPPVQDDKNVAHLTHFSEMEKKCKSLARITAILKDVIQNKDRINARLQQPYSLDCIPVEAEYQVKILVYRNIYNQVVILDSVKQFSELLLKAASDYGALTAAVADFQWCQNFKESPTVWGEMLHPIPAALASCTRFFETMSAMRDSFATLQQFRVSNSSLSTTPSDSSGGDSNYVMPPHWREGVTSSDDSMVDSWR
ncbi:hypothetical protein MUK42_21274 [Musa troglodytarum]|uniref:AUGMIN subunit 2 n=1 Tax=Musa troglodytarum TaxID=320322 RepID=A0A9E7G2C4_9LILI|nr:hypothetical protein MUK42_21274 [Musa troglodytarum]